MVGGLDLPSFLLAFGVTLLEMTEVVALVFALGAEGGALRPAALGAVAGVAVVGVVTLATAGALLRLPAGLLLWAASIVLFGFGLFLFRSTLRTYRRRAAGTLPPVDRPPASLPFTGGFAAGSVEAIEAAVVLLALTAGGHGVAALVGALAAGALLVGAAALVHQRVRRVKVPTLKLAATSALFAFSAFWGSEAAGVRWPGPSGLSDLYLLPLFAASGLVVGSLLRFGSGAPLFAGENR